jgi:hypothetical protein
MNNIIPPDSMAQEALENEGGGFSPIVSGRQWQQIRRFRTVGWQTGERRDKPALIPLKVSSRKELGRSLTRHHHAGNNPLPLRG